MLVGVLGVVGGKIVGWCRQARERAFWFSLRFSPAANTYATRNRDGFRAALEVMRISVGRYAVNARWRILLGLAMLLGSRLANLYCLCTNAGQRGAALLIEP